MVLNMQFSVLAIIAGLVGVYEVQAQGTTNWTIGQTVQTSSGPVAGHQAANTTVSEYLGIPFAKPPVGDLRWAAPVKYTGSPGGGINGTSYVRFPPP